MMKNLLTFSILAFLSLGCAHRYKAILPQTLPYDVRRDEVGLGFGYQYGVLSLRGNKRYAKKEDKKHYRVVAVKIENNTGKTLKMGTNLKLYSGQNALYSLDPESIKKTLRQNVPIYLLYSLLTVNKTECDIYGCRTTAVFPVGLFIAGGNMIVAANANKNFLIELTQFSLQDKAIANGQTVYALVGIPDMGFQPLRMEVIDEVASKENEK
jgi:hypothetical protein